MDINLKNTVAKANKMLSKDINFAGKWVQVVLSAETNKLGEDVIYLKLIKLRGKTYYKEYKDSSSAINEFANIVYKLEEYEGITNNSRQNYYGDFTHFEEIAQEFGFKVLEKNKEIMRNRALSRQQKLRELLKSGELISSELVTMHYQDGGLDYITLVLTSRYGRGPYENRDAYIKSIFNGDWQNFSSIRVRIYSDEDADHVMELFDEVKDELTLISNNRTYYDAVELRRYLKKKYGFRPHVITRKLYEKD